MKGVPVRLELGPRDIENGVATIMRRDTLEKGTLPLDGIADALKALLDDIHLTLYRQAEEFRMSHTYTAVDMDELTKRCSGRLRESRVVRRAGPARTRSRN